MHALDPRRALVAAAPLLLLLATGCAQLSIGTDPSQDAGLEFRGLVNGHANVSGLESYDGELLRAGLLGGADGDDWATLEIWPLGGVGVGLAGARVRVLPFELGLGTLFYDPEPFRAPIAAPDEDQDDDVTVSPDDSRR